ncbi:PhnJ protein [Yersinia pseudotuberculosis]|nr:Phosphonate metabolism protein PhnJ [Yersinia pseudotuberculosis]SUQ38052.1 PhnJ protein [Yersinia pseudotuberculosis]
MTEVLTGYNLGYLDEQTKRTLRRAILKAVAIPGKCHLVGVRCQCLTAGGLAAFS